MKTHIANSEISEALDLLMVSLNDDSKFHNEALELKRRNTDIHNKYRRNLITLQEYLTEKSKITTSLIDILSGLDERNIKENFKEEIEKQVSSKNAKANNKKRLVPLLFLLAGCFIGAIFNSITDISGISSSSNCYDERDTIASLNEKIDSLQNAIEIKKNEIDSLIATSKSNDETDWNLHPEAEAMLSEKNACIRTKRRLETELQNLSDELNQCKANNTTNFHKEKKEPNPPNLSGYTLEVYAKLDLELEKELKGFGLKIEDGGDVTHHDGTIRFHEDDRFAANYYSKFY